MLNKQITEGRLTADPELRTTASGTSVCSFSLASQEDFVNRDGERDTDFVECVAWRGTAEFIVRNCKKGRLIIVEGRPKTRKYKDAEGNERRAHELRVQNVYLTDSRPTDTGGNQQRDEDAVPPNAPNNLQPFDDDDDIPF